jgi:predicted ATPase
MAEPIPTPDQRLRVFVSSTLREMAPEREAARRAIQQICLTPVMFELGARAHPPRDLYRAYLDQSEIFVGMYGQSYGWVAPHMDISGLEDEYNLSRGKPRLLYVKDTNDRDEGLDALLARIEGEDDASYRVVKSPEDLEEAIKNDLMVLLSERFGKSAVTESAQEIAPEAPALHVAPAEREKPIGRDQEIAQIEERIGQSDVGLLTLTGPGGTGKTRLAIHLANRLAAHFQDGVYYVALSGVTEAPSVMSTIQKTLGIPMPQNGGHPAELVSGFLRNKNALLIIDNFEQVLDAAESMTALLARCPKLKILVTSQHALRVRGECEVGLRPLSVDAEADAHSPAVALFVHRAQAHRKAFELTEENKGAVVEICTRLDGLPLAIELAAARIRVLSPQAIVDRLDQSLQLLTGGARDLPERQRTLRGALDWSHRLLDDEEQVLFRRLGVFGGSFSLEAAQAVGQGVGLEIIDGLEALVDKSLLTRRELAGDIRFSMLSTIREFAREKLDEAEEVHLAQIAFARHFGQWTFELQNSNWGADRSRILETFNLEEQNLRDAVDIAVASTGDRDLAWQLFADMGVVFMGAARMADVQSLHGHIAPIGLSDDTLIRTRASMTLAWSKAGGYNPVDGEVERTLEESASELERLGCKRDAAWALVMQAQSAGMRDLEKGFELMDRSRALFVEAGNTFGQAFVTTMQSFGHLFAGNLDQARRLLEENLSVTARTRDDESRSLALSTLGRVELASGSLHAARETFAAAAAFARDKSTFWGRADALNNLCGTLLALGEDEEAQAVIEEAILLSSISGPGTGSEILLAGQAALLLEKGERERAVACLCGIPNNLLEGDAMWVQMADPVGVLRTAYEEAMSQVGDDVERRRGTVSFDDAVRAALGR